MEMPRQLSLTSEGDLRFMEGPPNLAWMRGIEDSTLVVEACLSNRATAVLLYAENLTPNFFDLSSGEAGAILQKLRQYRVRLAVVFTAAGVSKFSSRFREMSSEEARTGYFRMFETAEAARTWIRGS
jgi:hypothetical protein